MFGRNGVLGGFAADFGAVGDEIHEVELVAIALVAVDGTWRLFGKRAGPRVPGGAWTAAGGRAGDGGGGGEGGGESDVWSVRRVGLVVLRGKVVGGV